MGRTLVPVSTMPVFDKLKSVLDFFKSANAVLRGVGSPFKIWLLIIIGAVVFCWVVVGTALEFSKKLKEKHEGLKTMEKKFPRVFSALYSGKARFALLVVIILLLAIDWRDAAAIASLNVTLSAPPPPIVKLFPQTSVPSTLAVPQCPSQQTAICPVSVPTFPSGSVFSSDPAKAVETVNAMRNNLAQLLDKKETVTFLMSWPDDDSSNLVLVSGIFSSACRTTPRQCWFIQKMGSNNLDYPQIPEPNRRGLTIHGADALNISALLGQWFTTYSSSAIPPQLNAYKHPQTKELIWIEIGPGSPWKPTK
jgi:hypothetical protein